MPFTNSAPPVWQRVLDSVIAVLLFAMMLLEFLDVVGRYVVNRPVPGSTEIIQYLLVLTIFVGLPVVTWRDEHISISLVEGRFGNTFNRLRRAFVRALSGVVMLAVSWFMWGHAEMLARNRDIIGFLELPVAPAAYAVNVLAAATGFAFLVVAVHEARGKTHVHARDLEASVDYLSGPDG